MKILCLIFLVVLLVSFLHATEFPYWMSDNNNTFFAKMNVTNNTTYYVYENGTTDKSSMTNTMIDGDDFGNMQPFNSSKYNNATSNASGINQRLNETWLNIYPGGVKDVTRGWAKIFLNYNITSLINTTFEERIARYSVSGTSSRIDMSWTNMTAPANSTGGFLGYYSTFRQWLTINNVQGANGSKRIQDLNWHRVRASWNGTNTLATYTQVLDGEVISNTTNNTGPGRAMFLNNVVNFTLFYAQDDYSTNGTKKDWWILRKFSATEPTITYSAKKNGTWTIGGETYTQRTNITITGGNFTDYQVEINNTNISGRKLTISDSASGAFNCSNLTTANSIYTMTQNLSINGVTCINITAENITLRGNGFSITGNSTASTYGIFSNSPRSVIANVSIVNFQAGVYLDPTSTNSNITGVNVTSTGVASASTLYGIATYADNTTISLCNLSSLVGTSATSGNGQTVYGIYGSGANLSATYNTISSLTAGTGANGVDGSGSCTFQAGTAGTNAGNLYGIYWNSQYGPASISFNNISNLIGKNGGTGGNGAGDPNGCSCCGATFGSTGGAGAWGGNGTASIGIYVAAISTITSNLITSLNAGNGSNGGTGAGGGCGHDLCIGCCGGAGGSGAYGGTGGVAHGIQASAATGSTVSSNTMSLLINGKSGNSGNSGNQGGSNGCVATGSCSKSSTPGLNGSACGNSTGIRFDTTSTSTLASNLIFSILNNSAFGTGSLAGECDPYSTAGTCTKINGTNSTPGGSYGMCFVSSATNLFTSNSNEINYTTLTRQKFYSDSAQNISSTLNIGWFPLATSNGSDANNQTRTAFFNVTGGLNANLTYNASLTYWYGGGGAADPCACPVGGGVFSVLYQNNCNLTTFCTASNFNLNGTCGSFTIKSGGYLNSSKCTFFPSAISGCSSFLIQPGGGHACPMQ